MKKTLNLILIALFTAIGITASAQNSGPAYGTQFDNRSFENWSGLEDEPYHWHSTKTASGGFSGMLPSGVISSDTHTRPGTASGNTKSAKVLAKKVIGSIVAQGNITNGRMNAGSMTAAGTSNYNYTDRTSNNGVHCTLLNGYVPDSVTVWVCLYTQNSSHQGKLYSAIHDDYNFKYIANATIDGSSHLVKAAYQAFDRTTSSTSTYTWRRLSVPYGVNPENSNNPATGSATNAKYVFIVVTSNKTAGTGTDGDYLLVDDILLIYNPTLTTGTLAKNEYNVGESITIPFTLTGTMSPENLNKAANEVIAELSDANGNFGTYPVELGRVTTNVTGSITVTLPDNIPSGTGYRVRVRTTNYPMTANDNGVNIKINGYSNVYASVAPENSGSIELANGTNYGQFSEGYFLDGTNINITATANAGYSFANWTVDNNVVSTNANYSFTMNGTTTLVANFAQAISITANANPSNGGTVTGGGYYASGATCTLTATPNTGYVFVNWTKNGTQVSTNANYSFTVTENTTYTANFVARHTITVNANPTNGGTVTGAGAYDNGSTVTLTATPNSGYAFVNWTKNGTQVSTNATYSFTATESATYTANFVARYTITVNANPTNGGTVTGGGTYDAGSQVTLTATANSGYTFKNWTKNGSIVSTNATYTINSVNESATYTANFATQHTITLAANPTNGGTVTGGGTYESGTSINITATPNNDYTFINWTKGGNVVSTTAITNITVNEDATYTANFARTYKITVNATEGGTATGGGNYAEGSTATLTATAETGYVFVNWTQNGQEVSTDAEYSFTVTSNATFTANFDIATYGITVSSTEGGSANGGGTFEHGSNATITATAETGYVFVNWTKDGQVVSTDAVYTFTVTEGGNYVANFEIATYQITANATQGGSTTGSGTYQHGSTATLTATANNAYVFVNWTKDGEEVSTNAIYSFVVTESGTYTANFATQHQIIVNTSNATAGTATGGGTYAYGQEITISATANVGYSFVNWTVNGNEVSTDADYTFIVTNNATYTANFEVAQYEIIVTSSEGGNATGGGTYQHGTSVTIAATPDEHYEFINWTKNGAYFSEEATVTFTATESATFKANFAHEAAPTSFIITASATAGGTITPNGSVTVQLGTDQTFIITPNEHKQILEVVVDNIQVGAVAEYTFYNITEYHSITASFEDARYQVNTSVNIDGSGTVTPGNEYTYNTAVTLTATANEGYEFVNWTDENGTIVSETASFTFNVTEDVNYTANFIAVYVITVNHTEGGTADGGGTYHEGETAHLSASADEGYIFVNWTKDGQEVSTLSSFDITVTESATYTANFIARYRIIVTSTEGGTAIGGGYYNAGQTATLRAFATEGYIFSSWTKDDTMVSTEEEYTITVTENATYTANFTAQHTITVEANEGGTAEGGGIVLDGDEVTIIATPDDDHLFDNWTKNGEIVSTEASYTFVATESATYVANFIEKASITFTITAIANEHGSITPQGEVTVTYGQDMIFTITPDAEYEIVNVTVDGNDMGSISEYTFENVMENHSIEVTFEFDGIEAETAENEINIYPNPASRTLFIKGDINEIRIYNINGVLVHQERSNGAETIDVNIANLARGLYTVQCIGNDNITTRNFIKK